MVQNNSVDVRAGQKVNYIHTEAKKTSNKAQAERILSGSKTGNRWFISKSCRVYLQLKTQT